MNPKTTSWYGTKGEIRSLDQLLCYACTESLNEKLNYVKALHQWINTWLKEDPKSFDLFDCFYACYYSLRQKANTNTLFKLINKIHESASLVD